MSERAAFGPYFFSLTNEEARIAASRIALRVSLARRFERDHVAPLAVFVLLLLFISILAFSGLIGRRLAGAALLVSAICFLAARFLSHWRLDKAQRQAGRLVGAIISEGEVRMEADHHGLTLETSSGDRRRPSFQDFVAAENAGGMVYLWRANDEASPIILPIRIFADGDETERFLAFAQAEISAGRTIQNSYRSQHAWRPPA